jgi:capsid portal protein
MSKTIKKRYLKALNRNLKKESAGKFDTLFVFSPLGAKPKDATGVTASGPADAQVLALMEAIQARVFAEFENSAKRA